MQLNDKVEHFLTPLGVGDTLIKWGIPAEKVQQLDWWDTTHVDGLELVATCPSFSGRGMGDSNATLWASWVIIDNDLRVFLAVTRDILTVLKRLGIVTVLSI